MAPARSLPRRYELTTVPRLAAALRELPPQLREAEGSWQHGLLQGAHSSAATQLINPTTEVQLATIDQGAGERVEAVPAAERAAQRMMSRSSASLCFLGTGAMKPSAHRNVRPLLQTPCTRHARAMHAPCTRYAHAMHTLCTRYARALHPPPLHTPCTYHGHASGERAAAAAAASVDELHVARAAPLLLLAAEPAP